MIKKLMLIILVVFAVSSCNGNDDFNIEQNNDVFFESLMSLNKNKVTDVTDLSICYYNQDYYYEVSFYVEGKETHYHQLFEIHINYLAYKIPLNNIETSKELQEMYSVYLTDYDFAKENGESKTYTDVEIEKLVSKYINK